MPAGLRGGGWRGARSRRIRLGPRLGMDVEIDLIVPRELARYLEPATEGASRPRRELYGGGGRRCDGSGSQVKLIACLLGKETFGRTARCDLILPTALQRLGCLVRIAGLVKVESRIVFDLRVNNLLRWLQPCQEMRVDTVTEIDDIACLHIDLLRQCVVPPAGSLKAQRGQIEG